MFQTSLPKLFRIVCLLRYANAQINLPKLTAWALHKPNPDSVINVSIASCFLGCLPKRSTNSMIFSSFFFANALDTYLLHTYRIPIMFGYYFNSIIFGTQWILYTFFSPVIGWDAFCLPVKATGLIIAVANTQSYTD